MELAEFIKTEIVNFIDDELIKMKNTSSQVRTEETGLFSLDKDYEAEISRAMREGELIRAKRLYTKLLDKFENPQNLEENKKIELLLKKVTEIIKNEIKEYNQELIFQDSFDKYNKFMEKNRGIPDKISGKLSDISFFDSEETNIKEKPKEPEQNINLNINYLPENQLLLNKEKRKINTNEFKKVEIEYENLNPTHIIKLFSPHRNNYLILTENLKNGEEEVFLIKEKPKSDKIIIKQ
jgi:hypothetical protein